MALRDVVVDAWAALSHKAPLSGESTADDNSLAPTWVNPDNRRRLDAYKVLAAYLNNIGRKFLPPNVDDETRRNRREYGDPDLLVDRVMAGVLGDSFEIVVEGADNDLPDEPELPPAPADPRPDADNISRRVFTARQAMWTSRAAAAVDEWEQAWAEQPDLRDRQEWLRRWADDELVAPKIIETERDIIGLGDGVYVLAWSAERNRPVVDIYDPGFYFPVITDTTRDYPLKVHVAWEFEGPDRKRYVRRITWELRPIAPTFTDDLDQIDPVDATLRVDPDTGIGEWVRDYPWNVNDDGTIEPSPVSCYLTDATFPYDQLDGRHVNDFDLDRRDVAFGMNEDGAPLRDLDLHIDFLPVVHIPNTPAHREHFGRSILTIVAQILDDLAASDTDVQAASSLAAGPVVHLAGASLPAGRNRADFDDPTGRHYTPTSGSSSRDNQATPELEVRPGAVFRTGEQGRMDVLDMSKGLAELRNINGGLLDRLSQNARVPAELLGRVKASEVPSGLALALAFGPFTQLVGVLRMAREPKYRLILKFAQRLAMLGGTLEPGRTLPARFAFGSYLPSDRAQLVDEVKGLLTAKAISTQTAVGMLVDGGFSVDDARGEVQRIRYEHAENAKHISDAVNLGDAPGDQAAADWLGIELPDVKPEPPVVNLPVPVLPPVPPPEQ